MPFEFAFLDWLLQFHTPTMDALAVFFNYAGAHGEIWIALTLILLFSRRTRRAGLAMALALGLYMITGHFLLKPLFARPRPCDLNKAVTLLVPRPNGYSFPSGHTSSAFAAAWALFRNDRQLGIPALVLAAFIGFTRLYLCMCTFPPTCWAASYSALCWASWATFWPTNWQNSARKNKSYKILAEKQGCFTGFRETAPFLS